jgi:hypothetical protein
MTKPTHQHRVYLETGQKRTMAVSIDWPGWCRGGKSESAALQALLDYAPRYARVVQKTQLAFHAPSELSNLLVIERVAGNASTDFGVPGLPLASDAEPVEADELARWHSLLHAIWQAFDAAVQAANGKELTKGPRGGGRELEKIVEHVRDGNLGYLTSLGGKPKLSAGNSLQQDLLQVRQAVLNTLEAKLRGELPTRGPRGGLRWPARYFVRRLAWHELDHLWEIEDRAGS